MHYDPQPFQTWDTIATVHWSLPLTSIYWLPLPLPNSFHSSHSLSTVCLKAFIYSLIQISLSTAYPSLPLSFPASHPSLSLYSITSSTFVYSHFPSLSHHQQIEGRALNVPEITDDRQQFSLSRPALPMVEKEIRLLWRNREKTRPRTRQKRCTSFFSLPQRKIKRGNKRTGDPTI